MFEIKLVKELLDNSLNIISSSLRGATLFDFLDEDIKNYNIILYELYDNENQVGVVVIKEYFNNKIIYDETEMYLKGKYELHIIAIDKKYRKFGYGSKFMNFLQDNYKEPIYIQGT